MNIGKKHRLIEIEWPAFGDSPLPPQPSAAEYLGRIEIARTAMEADHLTHLVVYGDREHFSNLFYLSGVDPRFEESLLIIGINDDPLLVVGNEVQDYLGISPLFNAGRLRSERFQSFSLLDMPRGNSRILREIFADEGIGKDSRVGCIDWKYYSETEQPDSVHALNMPAYMIDTLRNLAGWENVINVTGIFQNPDTGLRTYCSPSEIAFFEWSNIQSSEGMKRMLFGIQEGMIDFELAKKIEYNGIPLGCHMTLVTGDNRELGLSSPAGYIIRKGDPLSTNYSYWGSNICRAGWVAESADDLPMAARDYVENFAGIYFEVMCVWLENLRIGTIGGDLARLIADKLPYDKFGIYLNPGHLFHLDEGMSSPMYLGSTIPLHSGMGIQVDVIPYSPVYFSTRMEDGVVLADKNLRELVAAQFPECYDRCQQRRDFMINVLGIQIPDEILPLSNIPTIVPPYFLAPNTILALEN